jgi:hypothetical protein
MTKSTFSDARNVPYTEGVKFKTDERRDDFYFKKIEINIKNPIFEKVYCNFAAHLKRIPNFKFQNSKILGLEFWNSGILEFEI